MFYKKLEMSCLAFYEGPLKILNSDGGKHYLEGGFELRGFRVAWEVIWQSQKP